MRHPIDSGVVKHLRPMHMHMYAVGLGALHLSYYGLLPGGVQRAGPGSFGNLCDLFQVFATFCDLLVVST